MANISATQLRIVIINQFSSNHFKNQTRQGPYKRVYLLRWIFFNKKNFPQSGHENGPTVLSLVNLFRGRKGVSAPGHKI